MAKEKHVGINFFVQANAAMRIWQKNGVTSECVEYSEGDATATAAMLKAHMEQATVDDFAERDDEGAPAWFATLKKFKFGDHDGDGTLEMGVVESDDDEHGMFVRFVEAGDNLFDLMRAAWMEENPVILRKKMGDDASGT